MTYSDWVSAIGAIFKLVVTSSSSPTPFQDTYANTIIPRAIEYAEQCIYPDLELDLLVVKTGDPGPTAVCQAGSRTIAKPASVIVVEDLNLITPAGNAPGSAGSSRTPLERSTIAVINSQYPAVGSVNSGPPKIAVQINETTFLLGPTADQAYQVEFSGTTLPAPLSSANTTTVLATQYPSLFLAATAVFMAGFQKNFGSQADDPKMALSWKAIYQDLKQIAVGQEMRKKFRPSMRSNAGPPIGA